MNGKKNCRLLTRVASADKLVDMQVSLDELRAIQMKHQRASNKDRIHSPAFKKILRLRNKVKVDYLKLSQGQGKK